MDIVVLSTAAVLSTFVAAWVVVSESARISVREEREPSSSSAPSTELI